MRSPTRITAISALAALAICIFLAAPISALITKSTQSAFGSLKRHYRSDSALFASAPTVSSLSPSSVLAGGPGFTLTVVGVDFGSGLVVRINGSDRVTTLVDSTQLTTLIDAAEVSSAGTFSVTVFDPSLNGGESIPLTLTINNPVPTATNLSPSAATAGGPPFTLTVNGSNFVAGSIVNFRGVNHAAVLVNSTQLTVPIGASEIAAGGTISVTVTNLAPGGGTTAPLTFTANNPVPTVTTVAPTTRFAGDQSFALTVNGTNFNSTSVVRLNGNARNTTLVSVTQLTAQILATDIAAVGAFPVTVANPVPAGGTSNAVNLTVTAAPVPSLASISPTSVAAGTPNLTLTVNGTNFFGGSVVRVGGSSRPTTFVSNTQLTAALTAVDLTNSGVFPITVFNPAPGGGTSAAVNLTVSPSITSLAPTTARVGAGGFTLTVNGAGFVSGAKVRWNGSNKSTTFVNATKLTASISSSDTATQGTFPVTVLNPAPTNLISNAIGVTVTPAVNSLTPMTAITGDPDFTLTVIGAGFVNGATINWGGTGRPTTFVNSTKLTASIQAADIAVIGTFPITVLNPGPTSLPSNALNFTVTDPTPASECPAVSNNALANPGLINFGPEKSQLWYNDNTWWGAFSNNTDGIYIYKQTGTTFTQGPLIDTNIVAGTFIAGSPDTLWDGTNLFILIQESTVLARLYKYNYDSASKTYTLLAGFPLSLPLAGSGTNTSGKFGVITLDEDSTGKLWAAYAGSGVGGDGKVHVIWSTSADHKSWNTAGFALATGISISTQEAAPIIHFGTNKIGVVWSNQSISEDAFRYHIDGDPETVWSVKEIIDSGLGPQGLGSVAENHMSLKAAPDGRLFLIAKDNDGSNHLHLYIRTVAGTWGQKTLVINDFNANPTRPVLVLDTDNNELHVIYKDSSATGTSRTFITQSFMDHPAFNTPCPFIDTSQSTQTSSNPTASKQNINAAMDLMVAASTGKKGNTILFNTIDITPSNVTLFSLSPTEVTAGESTASLTLTVNGKLFTRSPSPGSIVSFNGVDRTTTYLNAGKLTAPIPAVDLISPGIFPVKVTNPDNTVSNTINFVVTATNPPPNVSAILPNREPMGSNQFTMTVTGSGFRRTSVVQFNGGDRPTTFASDTRLTAVIPATDLLTAGPFPITVLNPAPGGGTSPITKASTFFVQPPCPGSSPQSFSGITAFNTVKAQMWRNDGIWWGAFSDNAGGIYFYKQSGTSFTKGALIDGNFNGRPDVKWNGTNLFVLVYELNTQAKLYKYSYNTTTKVFTLLTGFPVSLPLIGVGSGPSTFQIGSITFDQDSTGKLWAAYPGTGLGGDGNYRVIWSTSADHKVWDTNGFVLASGGSTTVQEVTPVIHFGGNRIGVAWSNQVAKEFAFREHIDGSPETSWGPKEVIDFGLGNELGIGGVADNHMSVKAAPDGRLFLATKDSDGAGYVHLYIRSAAGLWSDAPILVDIDPQAQAARPTLLLDLANSEVYVIYEDAASQLTYLSRTSMDVPIFGPACPYFSQTSITNVTSTKQNLNALTGLMAAGSSGGASSQIQINPITITQSTVNPVPALSGISPTSIGAGGGPFTLTISGSNFVVGAVVYLNGRDLATTFVGPTQLTTIIPAPDIQAIGTLPITVMNPRGGTSAAVNLTVNPSITNLLPANQTAGGNAFTLTVNGVGFASGAVVRWNGTDRPTTFVNATQLTALISASDIQVAGLAAITVINPGVGAGTSAPASFPISNPIPSVDNINPAAAIAGTSAFTLIVNGSNFVNGSVISVNGTARATTFVSSTQLTVEFAAADLQSPGVRTVAVFNPAPGGGLSTAVDLTIANPAPTLASVLPVSTIASGPGLTLTVDGGNFVNGSVVRLNGNDRPTNFVNSGQLTAQIPASDIQAAGIAGITVFNPGPGGGLSGQASFTVNNPLPSIGGISPANISAGGGPLTLNVNGSSFVTGSIVRFNGGERATTFVSATQLTAELTAADLQSTGTFSVDVVNPLPGGGLSNSLNLAVDNPVPTISGISPDSAAAGDGPLTLTVNGGNFVVESVVRWNGSVHATTFVSGTQLTAEISAAEISAPGPASVAVFNAAPGGGVSNQVTFMVRERALRISNASAASGSTVALPIQLDALGNEHELGFSVDFDTALLGNPQATLGGDAGGATLTTDTASIGQGHFGLTLSLPAGQTFAAGPQQIAVLTFALANVAAQAETPITFGDQPTPRGVLDTNASNLPITFAAGTVTITTGYEADVAPRPNGSNNGTVSISDWAQTGRFSSGADTPSPGSEFQRADCAPRTTRGNGSLTIADWVQAGRYAAGLDPVSAAGGPTTVPLGPTSEGEKANLSAAAEDAAPGTIVRLVEAAGASGWNRSLSLEVEAQGNENALGFSLIFDPAKLRFVSAQKSTELNAATLNVNELDAAAGRVGIALALPAGSSFGPGTHQVVVLTFAAQTEANESALISFADKPVAREVVDVDANPMKTLFQEPSAGLNNLDDPQSFVTQQSLDFLKSPAAAGSYKAAYGQRPGNAQFWLNVLNNKEPDSYSGLVCSFLASCEYRQ